MTTLTKPQPRHSTPCPELIRSQEQINNLDKQTTINTREIRTLIELAAQVKLLMSLSIGGGAMSLINLILVLIDRKP
jgi:hypothetical protein